MPRPRPSNGTALFWGCGSARYSAAAAAPIPAWSHGPIHSWGDSVSNVPDDLRYTAEHEWVKLTGPTTVRIGITDYAQNSLGDIVFVSVHEVGAAVAAGDTFGEV